MRAALLECVSNAAWQLHYQQAFIAYVCDKKSCRLVSYMTLAAVFAEIINRVGNKPLSMGYFTLDGADPIPFGH